MTSSFGGAVAAISRWVWTPGERRRRSLATTTSSNDALASSAAFGTSSPALPRARELYATAAWAPSRRRRRVVLRAQRPDDSACREELEAVKRAATLAAEEGRGRIRKLEEDAERWRASAQARDRDLAFAKTQLEQARRDADAGLPNGFKLEKERRDAVRAAEDALHRLRRGEDDANAAAAAMRRELEDARNRAARAAADRDATLR